MTDEILEAMSPLFDAMFAEGGRPSIPPEKLLRAQLLRMLYSVRSERLLMEEIDYSILYRWFVGLYLDEKSRMDLRLRRRSLQPGAHAEPDPDCNCGLRRPQCLCRPRNAKTARRAR